MNRSRMLPVYVAAGWGRTDGTPPAVLVLKTAGFVAVTLALLRVLALGY